MSKQQSPLEPEAELGVLGKLLHAQAAVAGLELAAEADLRGAQVMLRASAPVPLPLVL